MLDFLFALGQFICFIGLLYGLVLAIVNYRYAGPDECRYDPVVGHDWDRELPEDKLQLIIVPEIRGAININRRTRAQLLQDPLQEH